MSIRSHDLLLAEPDCNYNRAELQFASIIGEYNAAENFPEHYPRSLSVVSN